MTYGLKKKTNRSETEQSADRAFPVHVVANTATTAPSLTTIAYLPIAYLFYNQFVFASAEGLVALPGGVGFGVVAAEVYASTFGASLG